MLRFSLFLLLCLLSHSLYAACTVIDDAGKAVSLKNPAQRVISLAPHLTELVYAVGGGQQMIAVMRGSDYPAAALKLPIIGSAHGIDLEKIVALKPDLIVTWDHYFQKPLSLVKNLGVPVYISSPHRLDDIPRTMINLGCLLGQEKSAQQTVAQFQQTLKDLRKRYQGQKKLRVFYQIGAYSFFTINKQSWINDVINLCGGENIFANAPLPAPQVSVEAIVAANPDVIISDAEGSSWKSHWTTWQKINAVNNGLLFAINPDLIDRPGPRILFGAAQICADLAQARKILH